VLFEGVDAAGRNALWVSDGQTAHEITGIIGSLPNGLDASNFLVFDHQVLFSGFNATGKQGLWVTDGTSAGTHEITVNDAFSGGVRPTNLTLFNKEVLFQGVDAAGTVGLWVTDGTTKGTHEITGISGANSSGLAPTDLIVFPEIPLIGVNVTSPHAASLHTL
jgi:ELWxxDGT repeat protein